MRCSACRVAGRSGMRRRRWGRQARPPAFPSASVPSARGQTSRRRRRGWSRLSHRHHGRRHAVERCGQQRSEGVALSYQWSVLTSPACASTFTGTTTVSPTFTADRDGEYRIGLVVSDGVNASAVSMISVTATPPPRGFGADLKAVVNIENQTVDSAVARRNARQLPHPGAQR